MIKQQSISRLATQISHPWFWKLKRDQAIRILESESLPQKGNFCVRPRKVFFYDEIRSIHKFLRMTMTA